MSAKTNNNTKCTSILTFLRNSYRVHLSVSSRLRGLRAQVQRENGGDTVQMYPKHLSV